MRLRSLVIRKGWHRSMFAWKPFFKNGKVFTFTFNDTARYQLLPPHELDINKLVGFADGCLNHHKNSFRIGWRYVSVDDSVEIIAYTYVDGVREVKVLETINLYDVMQVEVICQDSVYRVLINGYKVHYIRRSSNIKWRYKHLLYPYFGGVKTAPHFILIMLNWNSLPKIKK